MILQVEGINWLNIVVVVEQYMGFVVLGMSNDYWMVGCWVYFGVEVKCVQVIGNYLGGGLVIGLIGGVGVD